MENQEFHAMASMEPFTIHPPTSSRQRPILVSVPHSGTFIPDEIRKTCRPEVLARLEDTDWFVDRLYDFASELGITMIRANYHRWVIDLNRDPDGAPLYRDGRLLTEVVPTKTFDGSPLYIKEPPNQEEITRRKDQIFWPYHETIHHILSQWRKDFAHVLFFDAHSINQRVPTISPETFPDLIVGDADGTSAHAEIIQACLEALKKSSYSVAHNYPFKGGFLTRHHGKPDQGIHAVQLEMTKVNYMDEEKTEFLEERAEKMRHVLTRTLTALTKALEGL